MYQIARNARVRCSQGSRLPDVVEVALDRADHRRELGVDDRPLRGPAPAPPSPPSWSGRQACRGCGSHCVGSGRGPVSSRSRRPVAVLTPPIGRRRGPRRTSQKCHFFSVSKTWFVPPKGVRVGRAIATCQDSLTLECPVAPLAGRWHMTAPSRSGSASSGGRGRRWPRARGRRRCSPRGRPW